MRERVSRGSRNRVSAFKQNGIVVLSLATTPLLVFISSASDIYLKNQNLMQYQYEALAPFVKLSIVTMLAGAVISILSKYSRAFSYALWAYYLTGPVFLLFAFFRPLQSVVPGLHFLYQATAGLTFWVALLLVATVVLGRRLNPQVSVPALAIFGSALLAYEGGTLLYHVLRQRNATLKTVEKREQPSVNHSLPLPNIYHLIFDGYQTDLLEHTLSPESEETLGGFVYFPNNTAVWPYTPVSLATIFSGKRYFYDRPRDDYVRAAFDSRASFLYWLKSQGYETVAYVPNLWQGWEAFFDRMVHHGTAARTELLALNTEALWNLWLYSNTPAPLRPTLMRTTWFAGLDDEDWERLGRQRLLPQSAPVISYLGFQEMMTEEAAQSSSGRYTVVHVLLPHDPPKLRADCTYGVGSSKTGVLDQSQCALKLILDFINLLKDLGRFDDSLILVHGDHGGFYRTRNGTLVTKARSRSLDTVLLIKPVGVSGRGRLEVMDARTSLLDIPSIVIGSVADADSDRPSPTPWSRRRSFVPLLEGERLESAQLILERQGFSLGRVNKVYSDRYPAGTVISQDPPAYEGADDTEEITVVLSLGRRDGRRAPHAGVSN